MQQVQVMQGHDAQLRFCIFHKAITFRNAPLCPQTVCEQSQFSSNKPNLAGVLAQDKRKWNKAAPRGLPAVS